MKNSRILSTLVLLLSTLSVLSCKSAGQQEELMFDNTLCLTDTLYVTDTVHSYHFATDIDSTAVKAGFVLVSDIIPDAILEIRYYTAFNFIGRPIDGYFEPQAFLTRPAADALKKVSDEMVAKGYRIKIYDTYRPQMAVDHFVRWAKDSSDTLMKSIFYPEIAKKDIIPLSFVATKSGHSRGSTVDLTLFDVMTGRDVDMGGPFDYFGELSHPDYQNLTDEQKANRNMLRESMIRNGFRPLYSEWWHFTLKNEPYPDTYFNFPICTSVLKDRNTR